MENPGEKKFLEELEKSNFCIAEAGSVSNPSLFVLRQNGYRLGAYDSSTEMWESDNLLRRKRRKNLRRLRPINASGNSLAVEKFRR